MWVMNEARSSKAEGTQGLWAVVVVRSCSEVCEATTQAGTPVRCADSKTLRTVLYLDAACGMSACPNR